MKSPKKIVPTLGSDLYKIPLSSGYLPLVFCRVALQLNVSQTSVLCFDQLPLNTWYLFTFWIIVDSEMVCSQAKMELGGVTNDSRAGRVLKICLSNPLILSKRKHTQRGEGTHPSSHRKLSSWTRTRTHPFDQYSFYYYYSPLTCMGHGICLLLLELLISPQSCFGIY